MKLAPAPMLTVQLRCGYTAQSWNDRNGRAREPVRLTLNRRLSVVRLATTEDNVAHGFSADERGRQPWLCRDPAQSGMCVLVVYRAVAEPMTNDQCLMTN